MAKPSIGHQTSLEKEHPMDPNSLRMLSPVANGLETYLMERKVELCRLVLGPTVHLRWIDLQPDNYAQFKELDEQYEEEMDIWSDDDDDDDEAIKNPQVQSAMSSTELDKAHHELLALKMKWLKRKYEDLPDQVSREREKLALSQILAALRLDERKLESWLTEWKARLKEAAIHQGIVDQYGENLAPLVLGMSKAAGVAMFSFVLGGIAAKTAFESLRKRNSNK
jgi:hypothetical protein